MDTIQISPRRLYGKSLREHIAISQYFYSLPIYTLYMDMGYNKQYHNHGVDILLRPLNLCIFFLQIYLLFQKLVALIF